VWFLPKRFIIGNKKNKNTEKKFMQPKPNEYDGLYFVPADNDGEEDINVTFFTLEDEYAGGKPLSNNTFGDCWYVVFFKNDEEDVEKMKFDEKFEAIFADPFVYLKNLVGTNLSGCILRKTTNSGRWFEEYLKKANNYFTMGHT
jgi:hypothetical protein